MTIEMADFFRAFNEVDRYTSGASAAFKNKDFDAFLNITRGISSSLNKLPEEVLSAWMSVDQSTKGAIPKDARIAFITEAEKRLLAAASPQAGLEEAVLKALKSSSGFFAKILTALKADGFMSVAGLAVLASIAAFSFSGKDKQ